MVHTLYSVIALLLVIGVLFTTGPHGYVPPTSSPLLAQLAGAVGVSIGVVPNNVNILAMELQQREQQLVQREQEVTQREAALQKASLGSSPWMWIGLGMIALLLLLITANFYFDYRRSTQSVQGP